MNKFTKTEIKNLHRIVDAISKSKVNDSISSEYVKELKRVMPKLYLSIRNKLTFGLKATEIVVTNCNAYTDEKNVEKFMLKLANKLGIPDFDTYITRDKVTIYLYLE